MKFKVNFIFFLFCLISIIFGIDIKYPDCIYNLTGWNIPDISKLNKVSTEIVAYSKYLPKITVETYKYEYDAENDIIPYMIINKRILNGKKIDLREDLNTYRREWVQALKIFRLIAGKRIVLYQYDYVRGSSASEVFRRHQKSMKEQKKFITGIPGGGWESVFIIDFDNDGIFESKIDAFSILLSPEKDLKFKYLLNLILKKEDKKKNTKRKILDKFINLKKAWKKYLNCPSSENAKIVYNLLPNRKIKKNKKETKEEIEMWNWIWLTLPVLEKEMYAGDRNAVRVAFKLYPIIGGTYSVNLDVMIAHFARVNPKMFLEELKKHRHLVTPNQAIEGSWGLEYIGRANLRYLKLKNTMNALNTVNDPDLKEIRDECINTLRKKLDYLIQNFDIKE